MKTTDFHGIRLRLASPDVIRQWSHGEVTRPETINYRTQKPEKEGLFSEKIFGPSKDWECYCGKYKKIRYKGIVCDKCGVEVTRSIVRRERMGHIELAAPVAHIWFFRSVPSKIGTILDLSVQNLEKVVYFANFIITSVNEELREKTLLDVREEYKRKRKQIEGEATGELAAVRSRLEEKGKVTKEGALPQEEQERIEEKRRLRLKELDDAFKTAEQELRALAPMMILTEHAYHDLSLKYGHVFEAGIGAEAIRQLLATLDLPRMIQELEKDSENITGARKERLTRRLKLMKSFAKNKLKVEWMVLSVIPIIPPDLRPMVPLDGGRYATSDLNDLYRRVINRNNRLKQLQELNAPEVITRNEKRMLQEAVDALIDNSARHGKTVVASTGQKRMLKSIADMLKGKQGRFRQNLLGKRVDYSGRSVIVVGPTLKLHECGLPKRMALELFRPFIMSRLIKDGLVHNVRSAARFIDLGRPEIWDILEDIIRDAYVLLNRAPTLHRLGIQAFKPVLIEGKAIQIHPLVCTAFNADFDGDQMAVHIPLTEEAKREAREIMLSSKNLLKPATGDPVVTPNQDVVWGCYYMTFLRTGDGKPRYFSTMKEALLAYDFRLIGLRDAIMFPIAALNRSYEQKKEGERFFATSVGRLLFNSVIPEHIPYQNALMDKKALGVLVRTCLDLHESERTAVFLDDLKTIGFTYLTRSGLSWGIDDLPVLKEKDELIAQADREVEEVQEQYDTGLLTDSERHSKVINIWTRVKDNVVALAKESLDKEGSVYSMIHSGARGSWGQLTQIVGMKGLVTNPTGEIIELPVKRSFKEGFDVLEYFISTHGARKGLSDTALRTANAGYLTRRLVDVAQDIVVTEKDCGDEEGFRITEEDSRAMGEELWKRIAGRVLASDCREEKGKKILVKKGTIVTGEAAQSLNGKRITSVSIRSILTCRSRKGVCQYCYGHDLGFNRLVDLGVAVGIIAAQSIGEPGTQLTMRTFHTGGVVGQDITQGLPRVEEIFEVRPPKKRAFVAEVDGKVAIGETTQTVSDQSKTNVPRSGRKQKVIRITYRDIEEDSVDLTHGATIAATKPKKRVKKKNAKQGTIVVEDGVEIREGTVVAHDASGNPIIAQRSGTARIADEALSILVPVDAVKEYLIPFGYTVRVKDGDTVTRGDRLTDGSRDLHQLYRLREKEAVQKYVMKEIQYIYSSQGQKLNDKHIEVIARQMFSRVLITKTGDTNLLPGEIVERAEMDAENDRVSKEKGESAKGEELLLGISKVSLTTRSFLSAASFQETARVLINAAITGKIDRLEGLKENVIIGRLIPAGTGFHTHSEKA